MKEDVTKSDAYNEIRSLIRHKRVYDDTFIEYIYFRIRDKFGINVIIAMAKGICGQIVEVEDFIEDDILHDNSKEQKFSVEVSKNLAISEMYCLYDVLLPGFQSENAVLFRPR